MNERILQLAKQAGVSAQSETTLHPNQVKFAELIVRECLDVCDTGYKNEFTIAGIQQCTYRMKEHFGVE